MKFSAILRAAAIAAVLPSIASASVIGFTNNLSNAGGVASIIDAPDIITRDTLFNTAQQAFNEQQNILLAADLQVDGGVIAAGTEVSSHMIFLRRQEGLTRSLFHQVTWEFDGAILGVMSDFRGVLEASSSALLGAVGTVYPGWFWARGFEGGDRYDADGNLLTVRMGVTSPGDWIRVVTAVPVVPVPAGLPLLATGLLAFGWMRRRQKVVAA